MARTSASNVLALKDAAQPWNFDLFFPTVPGASGQAQNLTYKCKSSAIPSSKLNAVPVELHGVKKQEAGTAAYDHTFTATFLETVDYATQDAFRMWRKTARDWKGNTGTDSSVYKVNLEIDLYDNAGNVSRTMILVGSFPTDIAEVSLNGAEGTTAIELSITFSFDYISDPTGW